MLFYDYEIRSPVHFFTDAITKMDVTAGRPWLLINWLIEAEWRMYASLNWIIIGSDNGLSPVRRQAIIWTNGGILLIGPLGTNFSVILIGIQTFSFKKLHWKTSSAKWRHNELM